MSFSPEDVWMVGKKPNAVGLQCSTLSWAPGCRLRIKVTPNRKERVAREVAFYSDPRGLEYSSRSERKSKMNTSAESWHGPGGGGERLEEGGVLLTRADGTGLPSGWPAGSPVSDRCRPSSLNTMTYTPEDLKRRGKPIPHFWTL